MSDIRGRRVQPANSTQEMFKALPAHILCHYSSFSSSDRLHLPSSYTIVVNMLGVDGPFPCSPFSRSVSLAGFKLRTPVLQIRDGQLILSVYRIFILCLCSFAKLRHNDGIEGKKSFSLRRIPLFTPVTGN